MGSTQDQNNVLNKTSHMSATQMPLSHSVQLQNKHNDIIDPIITYLENINGVRHQHSSFEQAENAIRKLVVEVEKLMIQETLSQFDINTPVIEFDGQKYFKVLRKEKTYTSAAGIIKVERSLYRQRVGEPCICPMELEAGVIEDFWTPAAARIGSYVTAQLSPYQGEKLFKEMGHFTPSKSSLNRLSTRLGEVWDNDQEQLEQVFSQHVEIPKSAVTVSASLDGIMLPLNKKTENGYSPLKLVDNPTEAEKKKHQDKTDKAFYREASCAAINFYDTKGERLKTIKFGRMPEAGKKTLKAMILQTMAGIVSQRPSINVVKIADGALDNWRFMSDDLLPGKGTEILDYYHASEHLNEAYTAAFNGDSAKATAQYKKYRSLLKNEIGGIEKVINSLKYLYKKHPRNEKLKTELGYFRNNRHRMNYASAAREFYPIGSGVTEAACKTLVTQRLKCAGMRWDINGGQGVLTTRSLIQSELFTQGWMLLSAKYKKELKLPENIIAFKKRGIYSANLSLYFSKLR